MPVTSPRLGLIKPTPPDNFSTGDIANNWQKVDDAPGVTICTSLTRPSSWGALQEGMLIYETDTNLYWTWTGTSFIRAMAKGLLGSVIRTSDSSPVGTTSPTTIVSCPVLVPQGNRSVSVNVGWKAADGVNGGVIITIYRGTNVLRTFQVNGNTTPQTVMEMGVGGDYSISDNPGFGNFTYSLAISSLAPQLANPVIAGVSNVFLRGSVTSPIFVTVTEI